MSTWKKINEIGGAVVLRTVTGLFTLLALYGLVRIVAVGDFKLAKHAVLLAFISLFGAYTLWGNRMRPGQ